jgi:hypothetical protein
MAHLGSHEPECLDIEVKQGSGGGQVAGALGRIVIWVLQGGVGLDRAISSHSCFLKPRERVQSGFDDQV